MEAAHDLNTSHAPYCSKQLGEAFERSHRDGQRILCYALGSLGAQEWAWVILERLRSASNPQDLMGFALDGFSEMFRHARGDDVARISHILIEALVLDESSKAGGLSPSNMRYTLGHIVGDHIDTIIKKWLVSDSARVRVLGIDALGDARIRRAIPTIETFLGDANSAVRDATSIALATIDTPQAAEALIRSGPDTVGVPLCLHQIVDSDEFKLRMQDTISKKGFFRWAAVRAAGLRGYSEIIPALRELLDSSHELERGCALLALARLGDPIGCARVEVGVREASGDAFERVMSILAYITIHHDRYDELDAPLREVLASHSYLFWYPAQRDVIDVLTLLLQKFCLCTAATSSCMLISCQVKPDGRNSSWVQSWIVL